MTDFNGRYPAVPSPAEMAVDQGLRSFMLSVYNKLGLGLLLAGVIAYVTSSVPEVRDILFRVTADGRFAGYTLAGYGVVFAPLVLILLSSFTMKNPTSSGTSLLYWIVVATMGASLGVVLLVYTGASAAMTLGITALAFGGLSLVGYTTKRNLTGMGSFLTMAVIGLLIAVVVNMFLRSPMMHLVISGAGVLIFSGLIAYDTQRLKMTYYLVAGDQNATGVASSWGALSLFINFVNLFWFLLQFFGSRR